MSKSKKSRNGVILVAAQLPRESDQQTNESLDELERLVNTLGYRVVTKIVQSRTTLKGPTLVGEGKLAELASWTGGTGEVGQGFKPKQSKASLNFTHKGDRPTSEKNFDEHDETVGIIIFDNDLSPSQIRNIESATSAQILDRTGVIIEIFSKHAKTRAAKIQVEIAKLNYTAPRLRESAGGQDRAAGGIGAKGAGESKVELDKRKIRDRIKELKSELAEVQKEQDQRRTRRSEENSVALVGYTNAGKSSLMRALTESDVLVADQLFATLDTTVRPLFPSSIPKILISDTVGFIKKLPHDLVASFKTTLDEALNASLLLFVVDASDPTFRDQLTVTKSVLSEIGTIESPTKLILNKCDRLDESEKNKLKKEFPTATLMSAHNPVEIKELRTDLLKFFEKSMVDGKLFVKYSSGKAIGEIRSSMQVIKEEYGPEGIKMTVKSMPEDLARFRKNNNG